MPFNRKIPVYTTKHSVSIKLMWVLSIINPYIAEKQAISVVAVEDEGERD